MFFKFFILINVLLSSSFLTATDDIPKLDGLSCSPEKVQKLISRAYEEIDKLGESIQLNLANHYGQTNNFETKYIHQYLKPFYLEVDSEINKIQIQIKKLSGVPINNPELKKLIAQKDKLKQTKNYWFRFYGAKWHALPTSLAELETYSAKTIEKMGELEKDYRKMLHEYQTPKLSSQPFRDAQVVNQDELAFKMAANRDKMIEEIEQLKLVALKAKQLTKHEGGEYIITEGVSLVIWGAANLICSPFASQNYLNVTLASLGTLAAFCGQSKIIKGFKQKKLSPQGFNSKIAKEWKKLEKEMPPLTDPEIKKVRVADVDYLDNPPELKIKKRLELIDDSKYSKEEMDQAQNEIEELLEPKQKQMK